MSKILDDIALELRNNKKKVQLIYAFNGTGKTRISRKFKELISPKLEDDTEYSGEL
ncbi:TPA: anticodon nuclease, partial [Mannheimia haemolytica]|nr:anticodon nuclease [Mannheimia haemolytica]HEB5651970.1 anticodon nuclease [Mannheimia haemolytica]